MAYTTMPLNSYLAGEGQAEISPDVRHMPAVMAKKSVLEDGGWKVQFGGIPEFKKGETPLKKVHFPDNSDKYLSQAIPISLVVSAVEAKIAKNGRHYLSLKTDRHDSPIQVWSEIGNKELDDLERLIRIALSQEGECKIIANVKWTGISKYNPSVLTFEHRITGFNRLEIHTTMGVVEAYYESRGQSDAFKQAVRKLAPAQA